VDVAALTGIPAAGSVRPPAVAFSCALAADGAARVVLSGELDIATADLALRFVTGVIDRYRRPVALDLAGLSFCDAAGLGALVAMSRHAELAGSFLYLASPPRMLRRMIRLTGLEARLPVRLAAGNARAS
jgi:anti-sigma B factor antagonist